MRASPSVLPFLGITSLLVVALATHSHAAAWQGCAASYASTDCSGDIIAGSAECATINGGCEEDTTGDDAGTWDKIVSTADACAVGAVVSQSKGNADEATCDTNSTTAVFATLGECREISGYGSQRFSCTSMVPAAWQGCATRYASGDCSGEPLAAAECAMINSACEEDTTGDDAGTWDKLAAAVGVCADGVVIYENKGNPDNATCASQDATVATATIGACVTMEGGSQRFSCGSGGGGTSLATTTTTSVVVVFFAAVASHML